MRLSRADLVAPVLAIIAGGAIGVSLTFSPLVPWSPSEAVSAPDPVLAPSATAEALRLEQQRATARALSLAAGRAAARSAISVSVRGEIDARQALVYYVDGVRVDNDTGAGVSVLNDFNPEDIARIEVMKGPAAAALYGEEASAGVIQITLKVAASPTLRREQRR